jgi:hypothetical protein
MEKIESCILKISKELDVDEDYVRETIRNFLLYREFKEQVFGESPPKSQTTEDESSDESSDSEDDEDSSPDYEYSSSSSDDEDDEYSSSSDDEDDERFIQLEKDKTYEISRNFYIEAITALKNKNISPDEQNILEEFYRRQKIMIDEKEGIKFKGYMLSQFNVLTPYYFTINEQFTSEEIFRMALNSKNFILLVCSIVNNNYKLPNYNYRSMITSDILPRKKFTSEEDELVQFVLKGIELARKYKLPITWLHNRAKTKILLEKKINNSDLVKLIMQS